MLVILSGSCRKFKYRLSDTIRSDGKVLTFTTRCNCTGNYTDSSGKCYRRLMDNSTVSGIEHLVSNPVMMSFESTLVKGVTLVTAQLSQFDYFTVESE